MKTTLRSELRKLRHTRSLLAVIGAGVLVSVAAAAVLMTWIDADEIANRLSEHGPLRFGASNLGLILLVFGVRVFGDEVHHRTITPTFLATPDRRTVLLAKTAVAGGVAIATCVVIWAAVLPITAAGVAGRDLAMTWDAAETAALFARVTAAMTLVAMLAVALAAACRNRTAALVGGIVWLALAEDVIGGLLRIREYLPFASVGSLVAGGTSDGLSGAGAAAVLAGWTVLLLLVATASLRRDVS